MNSRTEPEPFALTGVRDVRTDGAQGDAIPFFHDGQYHLFFLGTPPDETEFVKRLRTAWRHLVSDDLIRWRELPVAVAPGSPGEPDSDGVWTGSLIQLGDTTHLFYTAHQAGAQVVCHATSTDLITFDKDPANPIVGRQEPFATTDWRDPFVFWNEEEQRYWMLISTRTLTGPPGRRGAVALAVSTDLQTWQVRPEPFYRPGITHCPECPEVFRIGGRWRLVFSRYSEDQSTVYRDADSLAGPWRTPEREAWDGARWYAAKSLTDDSGRRIAFGWAHDRIGYTNSGEWIWGGDFCWPREIHVEADGALGLRQPSEIAAAVAPTTPLPLSPTLGRWNGGTADAMGELATAEVDLSTLDDNVVLDFDIRFSDVRDAFGITIDGASLESGFAMLVEPARGTAALQEWPAAGKTDHRPAPLLQQPIARTSTGEFRIRLVRRGSVVEFFLDDTIVLTHRWYAAEERSVSVFVQDGQAGFAIHGRSL